MSRGLVVLCQITLAAFIISDVTHIPGTATPERHFSERVIPRITKAGTKELSRFTKWSNQSQFEEMGASKETTENVQPIMFPFDWAHLEKLNGSTSGRLINCCTEDNSVEKNLCLISPLPVCLTKSRNCLPIKTKSLESKENVYTCCCTDKAYSNTHDEQEDKLPQKINVKEVRTSHRNSNFCVCLAIGEAFNKLRSANTMTDAGLKLKSDEKKDYPEKVSQRVPTSKSEQIASHDLNGKFNETVDRRIKRSTISNPMIYPTFRHINERKRSMNSNFEMKMETGTHEGSSSGNWSSQLNGGHNFGGFGFSRRQRREIHVLMTRYRKKRSSLPNLRPNPTRRTKYFHSKSFKITTTPHTFLNVSFTGYTEKRKITTTKKPRNKPLGMTQADMDFVYGKKKQKPRFEAILGGWSSQFKIRIN